MQPQFSNLLSDHFSLVILPVAFLQFLGGSYTLLLFQIVMILAGAIGVYQYFRFKFPANNLPLYATFHFLSIWGIYSALAFDYHDNVTGAMLVPWLLLFFEQQKKMKAAVFLLLILISKENMALWSVFICLGLVFLHWKNKNMRFTGIVMMVFSLVYFVTVVKWVMPGLANEGREYLHFKYSALGADFGEMFKNILKNPLLPLKLLFVNQTGLPDADGIKRELHIFIALSGGIFLIFKPQYLIMLYAQKLFNDDFSKWGLNYQYSIEFVPVLAIGAFSVIGNLSEKIKKPAIWLVPMVCFFMTIKSLDSRVSKWYRSENHRFYSIKHYTRDFDTDIVYNAIKKIPSNANLSAQSPIVPHVAFRDYIYQFPVIENAQFILINKMEDPYPLSKQELIDEIKNLINSQKWTVFHEEDPVVILKRKD